MQLVIIVAIIQGEGFFASGILLKLRGFTISFSAAYRWKAINRQIMILPEIRTGINCESSNIMESCYH